MLASSQAGTLDRNQREWGKPGETQIGKQRPIVKDDGGRWRRHSIGKYGLRVIRAVDTFYKTGRGFRSFHEHKFTPDIFFLSVSNDFRVACDYTFNS